MRTVKRKGRTVIKKNKDNYRDPGEGSARAVWVFTLRWWAMVDEQVWFPGKRVLVLAPLQWCSWRVVGNVIGHFCDPGWWCAGRCWHYSFLGSDSDGLVAGMYLYVCSSDSWRAVLRTSEAALFGHPVSDSMSLCARQPLQRESGSKDAAPLFLSLSGPCSFQNYLEMRNTSHSQVEKHGMEKHRL